MLRSSSKLPYADEAQMNQIMLIYGVSALGAAAFSWYSGKREISEIAIDVLLYGGIIGTGVNVVFWLSEESKPVALPNPESKKCGEAGKLSSEGIKVLSQIDPQILYRAAKYIGVTIGPEGDDPHTVILPQE